MSFIILLVDDISEYLDTMELNLPNTCQAVRAESVDQAKVIAKESCPDLAILDIRLRVDVEEDQSGLELLDWLKQHCPETPAIMSSAYREFEYETKSFQHGASYFLRKPIQPEEFRQIVKETLL